MKAAVRYFSRTGNTKKLAKAIADGAGVEAVSVSDSNSALKGHVQVLFLGGGLYAYGLDKQLETFIDSLSKDDVDMVVAFSTSWLSKHALDLIRKKVSAKGIKVAEETCYSKSNAVDKNLEEAKTFAIKMVQ